MLFTAPCISSFLLLDIVCLNDLRCLKFGETVFYDVIIELDAIALLTLLALEVSLPPNDF
jgi:hypothetical protein